MTDYVKATNFLAKDSMATSNPLKTIRGSEIDAEYDQIAVCSATKANLASPVFTGTASFVNLSISGTANITSIDGGTW